LLNNCKENIQKRSHYRKKSSSEVMEKMLEIEGVQFSFLNVYTHRLDFQRPSDYLSKTGKPGKIA
jgi:hypothetical protein